MKSKKAAYPECRQFALGNQSVDRDDVYVKISGDPPSRTLCRYRPGVFDHYSVVRYSASALSTGSPTTTRSSTWCSASPLFEHPDRYEQGLREVARVLRPGGRFLRGMPAVNTMMELGFRSIGHKGIDDHHVTKPWAVAEAFDRAGLRVARHTQLRLIPGVPLYFNWLLEKPA